MNKVKLIFNSQFCGQDSIIIELENLTEDNIRIAFNSWIGIEPDENCSWVKLS